jgi:FkbM family methyltransferase
MSVQTSEILTMSIAGCEYRIIDPGGRIGSKLVNGEPYEKRLLADIHGRGLSGVAFDIGAHVGNHSLFLAAVCGLTVCAFEPHPVSYRMLTENVALNPGIAVRTWQVAAGADWGRARFSGRMTLKLDRGNVPVAPLDVLITPRDVAVVKVDVEGMEPEALAGMRGHLARTHPIVYAETHNEVAHRRIAHVLEPLGYRHTNTIAMGSAMHVWEVV